MLYATSPSLLLLLQAALFACNLTAMKKDMSAEQTSYNTSTTKTRVSSLQTFPPTKSTCLPIASNVLSTSPSSSVFPFSSMHRHALRKKGALAYASPTRRRKRTLKPSVAGAALLLLVPYALYVSSPARSGRFRDTSDSEAHAPPRVVQVEALKRALQTYYQLYPPNAPTQQEYVLYRALGNDLPPRHEPGQTYRNLAFILQNEEKHPRLDTRWYINRVINVTELTRIVRLLMSYNQTFSVDFLDLQQYANVDVRLQGLNETNEEDVLHSEKFRDLSEKEKAFLVDAVLHDQNQFLIHNNHARNAMLQLGLEAGAKYVLPWDGNCFLNREAWTQITNGIERIERANDTRTSNKYFTVPMARMTSNQPLLDPSFAPAEPKEEPQLIFHRRATERFNEQMRYGRRPKVEMLWRLQVPGPWDRWPQSAGVWEKRLWTESTDVPGRDSVRDVGWVARLFSGVGGLEAKGVMAKRGVSRSEGIELLLAKGKELWAREALGFGDTLMIYDQRVLEHNRELYSKGDVSVGKVVHELTDAAREVKKIKEFRDLAKGVTVLALAGFVTSKRHYYDTAATHIRSRLLHGDISIPTEADGACIGFFLDAVRLLKKAGALRGADVAHLRRKLEPETDTSAAQSYYNTGLPGVRYDLYAASVHAFNGNFHMLLRHSSLARSRLFRAEEMNWDADMIITWSCLAELAERIGIDVWRFKRTTDRQPILFEYVRNYIEGSGGDTVVYHVAKKKLKELAVGVNVKPVLETKDRGGVVPPFWNLGVAG